MEDSNYVVPLLINNEEVKTKLTFDIVSPATGKKVWSASSATKQEALDALKAAEDALPSWRATKSTVRRDIFHRAAALLEKRADEGAKIMIQETGAQEQFVQWLMATSVEQIRDVAGRCTASLSGSVAECGADGTSALIVKEPYGVIFSMAPWLVSPILLTPALITNMVLLGTRHPYSAHEHSRTLWQPATLSSLRVANCHHDALLFCTRSSQKPVYLPAS